MTQVVKRITQKSVLGKVKAVTPPNDGETVKAFRVYGHAVKMAEKTATHGDYYEFTGDFEAINLITGEYFRSSVMILPDIASLELSKAFHDERNNMVTFAFEIGVRADESAIAGYVFTCEPLVEQDKDNDPLANLRQSIGADKPKQVTGEKQPEKQPEQKPEQPKQPHQNAGKDKAKA